MIPGRFPGEFGVVDLQFQAEIVHILLAAAQVQHRFHIAAPHTVFINHDSHIAAADANLQLKVPQLFQNLFHLFGQFAVDVQFLHKAVDLRLRHPKGLQHRSISFHNAHNRHSIRHIVHISLQRTVWNGNPIERGFGLRPVDALCGAPLLFHHDVLPQCRPGALQSRFRLAALHQERLHQLKQVKADLCRPFRVLRHGAQVLA